MTLFNEHSMYKAVLRTQQEQPATLCKHKTNAYNGSENINFKKTKESIQQSKDVVPYLCNSHMS